MVKKTPKNTDFLGTFFISFQKIPLFPRKSPGFLEAKKTCFFRNIAIKNIDFFDFFEKTTSFLGSLAQNGLKNSLCFLDWNTKNWCFARFFKKWRKSGFYFLNLEKIQFFKGGYFYPKSLYFSIEKRGFFTPLFGEAF